MKGQLPGWLADWLGVESAGEGEAALYELETSWSWSPWATVVLIAAAAVWVVYFYARQHESVGRGYRLLLAGLRLGAVAVLLIMLAEFSLALKRTGPPAIALVVDHSGSMGIVDASETLAAGQWQSELERLGLSNPSRLDWARVIATADDARLLEELHANYNLQVYSAAAGVKRMSAASVDELVDAIVNLSSDSDDSQSSRLGDALTHVLRDLPGGSPAAVVMLTDGINTAGASLGDAAQLAQRKGVPLLLVGLGSETPPRDIELTDLLVDEVVFVDDHVTFQAQLRASGLDGETARVVLRREGEADVLAAETIVLGGDDRPQPVRLTHRPTEAGEFNYVVEVEVRDDEIDPANNRLAKQISVRDEAIRVLLAHGYPSYEFRYLKVLLERAPSVELSTYLQTSDAGYVAQDQSALATFPIGREALLEYDVLVFGDINPRLLPRSVWKHVQALVEEQGGGAVFIAGPRFLPWLYDDIPEFELLMPVELASVEPPVRVAEIARGFRIEPTPLGYRTASLQLGDSLDDTRAIWRNLPPVYWMAEIADTKPAAQVLAQHPTRTGPLGRKLPAMVMQYVGNGRVLFHAFDGSWRWRQRQGDTFFARYWIQTIRLLARARLTGREGAELTVERSEFRRGEPVSLRVRFRSAALAPAADDGVTVVAESADGRRQQVTLRRQPTSPLVFEGVLTGLAEGRHSLLLVEPALADAAPAAQLTVVAPPGEMARTEMDRAALESAAAATRGQLYTLADANRLVDDLPQGRRVPLEDLPSLKLWNQPVLLMLFLALVIGEWLLRRRKGMM